VKALARSLSKHTSVTANGRAFVDEGQRWK